MYQKIYKKSLSYIHNLNCYVILIFFLGWNNVTFISLNYSPSLECYIKKDSIFFKYYIKCTRPRIINTIDIEELMEMVDPSLKGQFSMKELIEVNSSC